MLRGCRECLFTACITHGGSQQHGTPLPRGDVSWLSHRVPGADTLVCVGGERQQGAQGSNDHLLPGPAASPHLLHLFLGGTLWDQLFKLLPPDPGGLRSFLQSLLKREWHLIHPGSQVSTISHDSPLAPLVMKTNLTLYSLSALGEDFCHVASPSLASPAFYNCTSTLSWIGLVLASSLSFQ